MNSRQTDNDKDGSGRSQPALANVVLELRALRKEWRQSTKHDGVANELPSQDTFLVIVRAISTALFPRHFGPAA